MIFYHDKFPQSINDSILKSRFPKRRAFQKTSHQLNIFALIKKIILNLIPLIIILNLSVGPNDLFSQGDTALTPLPPLKNQVLAGFLNAVLPGSGYFYCNQPVWGVSHFLGSQLFFWSSVLTLADLNLKFQSDIGLSFSMKFYDFHNEPIRLSIGVSLLVMWLGWRIFGAWHGSALTKKYNTKVYSRSLKISSLKFNPFGGLTCTSRGSPAFAIGVRF